MPPDVEQMRARHLSTPSLEILAATEGATDLQSLLERSWALDCLERRDEALSVARAALSLAPDDPQAKMGLLRAEIIADQADVDESIDAMLVLSDEPRGIEGRRGLCAIATLRLYGHRRERQRGLKRGDLQADATALQEAAHDLLKLDPRDPWGLVVLARARYALRDPAGALNVLDQLHDVVDPSCPPFYALEAIIARRARKSGRAASAWRRQEELLGRTPSRWRAFAFARFRVIAIALLAVACFGIALFNLLILTIGVIGLLLFVGAPLPWRGRDSRARLALKLGVVWALLATYVLSASRYR